MTGIVRDPTQMEVRMAEQQGDSAFTVEEILTAIGAEMKEQTYHLSKIRSSVGFLALLALLGLVASVALAAGG